MEASIVGVISKGNGGKTKGHQSHKTLLGYQVASEVNRKLSSVFPKTGEGRLMHAILSTCVIDALSNAKPNRSDFSAAFAIKTKQQTARRILDEPMWFASICGVSNSYVRRIMKQAYEAVDND